MPESGRHRLAVDRIEGELAVVRLDGGPVLDLPRWLLPEGVGEGDVVEARVRDGAGERSVELRVDRAATAAARREAAEILDGLRAADPGGDLAL